ncbi:Type VI secretion system protein ImpA [Candidatus Methylocalor cossyra]|uniref:Type VI secretion system protein ImpA n=2 Tax=Candidatus Methylocalor cossyra TaxID=3108543 RepID=A0ABM9NGK9_9GAMM
MERFLRAVAPDAPCGEDLEYDPAFIAVADKIKGTPEQQIGARIEPAQPPDWKELRQALPPLLERSRDLRLLVFLARTLLHTDGLPGFRDALELLERLLLEHWASIHPRLDPDDDNDPTQRVNILTSLCDFETILRPLAQVPLVESRVGRFSLRDVHLATDKLPLPAGASKPDPAAIRAAFLDADPAQVEGTRRAIADSLERFAGIETFLTEQVGVAHAPNLAPVRAVFKDLWQVLEEFAAPREALEGVAPEGGAGEEAAAAVPRPSAPLGPIRDRQDVIRALDALCEYYARCEPSSPVPLLLRRCKRLVPMGFLDIIKDLSPDALAQIELIKGPESADGGDG